MMTDFNNKTVLITGANGGIGRACVEEFAKNGANLIVHARKQTSDFDKFINNVSQYYGVKIASVYFDLSSYENIKANIPTIKKIYSSIDVLVNNAGVLSESISTMVTKDMLTNMFEINTYAPFFLIQFISRIMMRQETGGSIINLSSVAAFDAVEGQVIYGATKAALSSMTKSLAKELGRYKIRVNAVAPGVTQTPMVAQMKPEVLAKEAASTYLKKLAEPKDIAQTIVFLASDQAKHITGQILRVDGGRN